MKSIPLLHINDTAIKNNLDGFLLGYDSEAIVLHVAGKTKNGTHLRLKGKYSLDHNQNR